MRVSIVFLSVIPTLAVIYSEASAAFITVYGGPTYDATTQTGYQIVGLPDPATGSRSAGNGVAAGYANRYTVGTSVGYRAVRWDASGNPGSELGNLGTD